MSHCLVKCGVFRHIATFLGLVFVNPNRKVSIVKTYVSHHSQVNVFRSRQIHFVADGDMNNDK